MFFVLAQKKFMYGDEVEHSDEFDYDHPIGCYDDPVIAAKHAETHVKQHGVMAMVLDEDGLDRARAPKKNLDLN